MIYRSLSLKRYKLIGSYGPCTLFTSKVGWVFLLIFFTGYLHAAEYEGFTQPYHKADLSPSETGVVSSIIVKEGDAVSKGDLLLELDNNVLKASLKIADARQNATGALKSARARHLLHQTQLKKLLALKEQGHAQSEEVDQARANASVANADILTAQEEQLVHKYEYERLQEQIKRRQLFSPFDGVVTKIHKEVSELTSSSGEPLITVVQLNPLLLTIHVSLSDAKKLTVGQELESACQSDVSALTTKIEYIAPVTDPDSGTVRIKLLADNGDGSFPSGVKCITTI